MARRARPHRPRQARVAARSRPRSRRWRRARARPDHHRRLDRRQPRDRRADRRDRPQPSRAPSCCPASTCSLDDARLGHDRRARRGRAGARRPSAGAAAPADRRSSASTREDVETLGAPPPALAARAAFLSEALRPAESTDRWRERDAALAPAAVAAALDGVAIIVADNETEEALALAIAMREVLETPGKTAALVTPDPSIARRVSAELARWGVEVEDSAGRTLGESEAGALARLVLDAAIDFAPLAVQALLAHPAARFGRARADLDARRRARWSSASSAPRRSRSLDDLDEAFAAARAAAGTARPSGDPGDRRRGSARAAERLARDLVRALAPLRALGARRRRCATASPRIAPRSTPSSPRRKARRSAPHGLEALRELMEEWSEAAGDGFPCTLAEYAALFDDALAGVRAPPRAAAIRASRSSVCSKRASCLSIACCSPASTRRSGRPRSRPTPFSIGRCAPSSASRRRNGASARRRMISSPRSARPRRSSAARGSATASRPSPRAFSSGSARRRAREALAAAERRGETYLASRARSTEPEAVAPIKRPEPRPPVEAAPALAQRHPDRDPAARPLCDLRRAHPRGFSRSTRSSANSDAREAGEAWHGALQDFAERYPSGPLPPEARGERSSGFARARFAPLLADPAFEGLTWPNIEKGDRLRPRLRDAAAARSTASGSSATARSSFRSPTASRSADRAGRPHRPPALGRRGADRLQERDAAGPQGGEGRPRAAAHARGRDPARGGFEGLDSAHGRSARSISSSAARRRQGNARGRRKAPISPSSPRSISPSSRRCSTSSPARRRPICRGRSRNSRAAFPTTTISRGSRNGRRRAATADSDAGEAP